MQKKLTKHGNSLALIIDRKMLGMLGIDADSLLSLHIEQGRLIVSSLDPESRRKKLRAGMAEMHRKYGKALKRLAD